MLSVTVFDKLRAESTVLGRAGLLSHTVSEVPAHIDQSNH